MSNSTAPLSTAKNPQRLAIDGESFFACFLVDTRKQVASHAVAGKDLVYEN